MLKFVDEMTKSKDKYNKIAIGYFDGVHKGHQKILSQLDENDLIITFLNNFKDQDIYPIEDKIVLLKQYCPNIIIFDLKAIKKDSKSKFINYLKEFEPHQIITGEDFRFGYKASGSVADLEKHFDVVVVKTMIRTGERISSSRIRQALKDGDIKEAREMLTRPYEITKLVVKGNGKGSEIGIPTINFLVDKHHNLLRNGVYQSKVHIDGKTYKGVTNIGTRPTFDGEEKTIETHIIDFNQDIYGKLVTVELIKFIRDEQKFDSVNELVSQIKKDINQVKKRK